MNLFLSKVNFWLARYLQKEVRGYRPAATTALSKLKACLRPGDILLVEGNLRISTAIKYLTQSTWSHAALYVGPMDGMSGDSGECNEDDDPPCLIEADVIEGVRAVPLSKYAGQHTRICRAASLNAEDREKIVSFMIGKLGMKYDIKNAIDLLRYLLPQPPVPTRWRRQMLALGSGDPTRAICSTLIAQAFQSIKYPILPNVHTKKDSAVRADSTSQEIMSIRHHSLFTPRDFDISPYFHVIKPTIEAAFDHKDIEWKDFPENLLPIRRNY